MGATVMTVVSVAIGALVFARGTQPASRPAPLPTVIAADVPQYPREAAAAGIVGAVPMTITTDGQKVVSARVLHQQPGPSVLAEAALRHVRGWRFAAHQATTFDTMFHYRIVDRPCDSLGRDTHAAAIIHFGACEGGPVVTVWPGLTRYDITDARSCKGIR